MYRVAFKLEKEAALICPKIEPTRTVLYRSAISLALQIQCPDIAKSMANDILADNPHPEIADEIRELMKGV
jgi:hypothetical protein